MRRLATGVLCLFAFGAQANVIQFFAGISYNNPADLFKVKNNELILGTFGYYADLTFTGSAFNFNTFQYDSGVNHSRTYTPLPYGRIAKRINDQTVFSIDVTQPYNSNVDWGNYAFTRYAATQNIIWDVDISPKLAYSITPQLHVGAGINLNFLKSSEINWAMPTGMTSSANLINHTSSFGTGFNLGATYMINQTNFIGLAYYSLIRQNSTGYSNLDTNVSNNLIFGFKMPATAILSYVHIFNPTCLISLQAFQTEWSTNQNVVFYNTAAQPPFKNVTVNMNFENSHAFMAAVRHQYNEKFGLTLAGMIDTGPEQENLRTIIFPSYTQYFLGLVGDYHVNKTTTIELMYGHIFSNPGINNFITANNMTIPFTTGKVNINADVVDLKIKIQA